MGTTAYTDLVSRPRTGRCTTCGQPLCDDHGVTVHATGRDAGSTTCNPPPIHVPDYVAPEDRLGRASRDIPCRSCARRTDLSRDDGRWYHQDGTTACVDPTTLSPYPS